MFFRPSKLASAEDRLRAVMEAHFDFVWRSLRRLGLSSVDADDATQEVFLVVSRKLDAIEPHKEKRFLFATALRVASTWRRGTRRRREDPQGSFDEQATLHVADQEHELTLGWARVQLQAILDEMDLEQRAVFVLYELEQHTVPEIADTLSIPLGTVSSRLRAARERFAATVRRLQAKQVARGGAR